jgi:selenide,water dikinase
MSAALKKDALSADGYARMIANTTKLNSAGPELAAIDGVHALTDVTGFGLGGHGLELARGAKASVRIDWSKVPLLPEVRQLAEAGFITGASGRNWVGYGNEIRLPANFSAVDQALLTDPQTSGGLLVSCTAESVPQVLGIFRQHGFDAAAEIGEVVARDADANLIVE